MRQALDAATHLIVVIIVLLASVAPAAAADDDRFIVLASTTSTENSGLLAEILPLFRRETGIAVRVVAVGTGQALRLGENGDADVLLVHHRPSEDAFVAAGFGASRHDVMYNDFVLVGPDADPAAISGSDDVAGALRRIAAARVPFASRGDDSGTHKKELALWEFAGIDPRPASGDWYRETGSGMGATLNTARGMGAYTLADRGTWLRFASKSGLAILVEDEPPLWNPYGAILVNPERHPHVKAREGRAFIEWLTSEPGQAAIAGFRLEGEQAFFPSAR